MEKLLEISEKAYISESLALSRLEPFLDEFKAKDAAVLQLARKYLADIRKKPASFTQKMLAAYPIKSESGRALMSLAEALGRVPDKSAAYALIDDKIKNISWKPEVSGVLNTAVKAALSVASKTGANLLVAKAFEAAFKNLGDEFVLAENIVGAIKAAQRLKKKGYLLSYDMLGEGARTAGQAEHYFKAYMDAIEAAEVDTNPRVHDNESRGSTRGDMQGGPRDPLGGREDLGDSISLKLSALHPRYELLKLERLEKELLPKLRALIMAAKARNLKITIDAEEVRRLDLSLIIFTKLYHEFNYENLGLAVQAYNKRSLEVLQYLAGLGGTKIPVRLVKGAYWDAEIKRAQELGLPCYPLYTAKQNSDLSYLACAKFLLDNNDKFYPQFATHNLLTILAIEQAGQGKTYEFQKLFGMGDEVYDVLKLQAKVRIYAPVGGHNELLSYLIRRLLENGANSSFINQLNGKDDAVILRSQFALPTYSKLPLPADIFPSRINSKGADLGNLFEVEELKKQLAATDFTPQIFADSNIEELIANAQTGFNEWRKNSVSKRSEIIEKAADLLEENHYLLIKALMTEGKKTIADAISELREAVDFCRYYAVQAQAQMQPKKMVGITGEENIYSLHGRGVFACISPWNFPLAIFMGQVVAALVTGNAVIAKPAAQTPNIAALAVDILQQAGVPKAAVQAAYGSGSKIGNALVGNAKIAGVCFTGGTDTAKKIQAALLAHPAIIPFIAETGGQNAMIVDSTALLEQAVDDIITSAFGSAGQRCSALRVLFVQEEIAGKLIALIKDATSLLDYGNNFAGDVPDLIDEAARTKIMEHVANHGQNALPAIIELQSIDELKAEVFGPVLHIVRCKNLDDAIVQINSTGYGLTFGLHTRIAGRAEELANKIHAGNIYVNRSMIGAVVESQPFGGVGLSGTGFKAGGPNYLLRFCDEKVVTTNLTASGGNLEIL